MGSPMVVTLGQQCNVWEKPTVIMLYSYINHPSVCRGTKTEARAYYEEPLVDITQLYLNVILGLGSG